MHISICPPFEPDRLFLLVDVPITEFYPSAY